MNVKKGQPGYIKARKQRYLLIAIVEFAVVAALVIAGYIVTGSKMNLVTVVAVLICLPASKMLVEFITMAPYKGIDAKKHKEIEAKAPLLIKAYDMIVTSEETVMPISAVVISDRVVCGYTASEKVDTEKAAAHIRQMLRQNQFDQMTVKIFRDYIAFLSRAEGMNRIAQIEPSDSPDTEEHIKNLILSIAM